MVISPREERRCPSSSPETSEKMSTVQTATEITMAISISLIMIVITTVIVGMLERNVSSLENEAGPL